MARTKEEKAASKKRKADDEMVETSKKRRTNLDDTVESSSRIARLEPKSPIVQLPHTPGGTVPEKKEKDKVKKKKRKSEAVEVDEPVVEQPPAESESKPVAAPDAKDVNVAIEMKEPWRVGIKNFDTKTKQQKNHIQKKWRKRVKRDRQAASGSTGGALQKRDAKRQIKPSKGDAAKGITQTSRQAKHRLHLLVQDVRALEPRGLSAVADKQQSSAWSLSSSAGGRFINHDPVFARDPATGDVVLIAATPHEIQVLSIETSLPLRTFPLKRGVSIRSFCLDPTDSENLHIVCDNGLSVLWRWTGAELRHQALFPSDAQFVVGGLAAGQKHLVMYLRDTEGGTAIWTDEELYVSATHLHGIQILSDGEYIVAHGPESMVVGKRKELDSNAANYVWVQIPMKTGVTCLDARITHTGGTSKKDKRHAKVSLALGGKLQGEIYLYDDITSVFAQQDQASLPAPRILHWHREAVSAMKFSLDGSYLVSGGKETVLVLWQLETGKKQFLPHLTSEIERIVVSPEGDRYAVQMGDNSIMVLSTSELKPVANFAGLQLACPVSSNELTSQDSRLPPAVLHPHHSDQLLIAVPATQPKTATEAAEARPFLQTFDLRAARHITRQALTRNNITDFTIGPEGTAVAPPNLVHLAIGRDGQWLATVDEWMPPPSDVAFLSDSADGVLEERLKRREVYLKIWRWDEAQSLWTLSTRVDAPHARAGKQTQGAGKVFVLVSDPVSAGFATVGEDGRVRIWKSKTHVRHSLAMTGGDGIELKEWVCRRTIELPKGGDERADSPVEVANDDRESLKACLAYSEDASLLAASFTTSTDATTLVHLIDASTGDIKATKSGIVNGSLEHLGFLDRYLIAVTQQMVYTWDLVTDHGVHRHLISEGVSQLSINSTDGTFAIVVGSEIIVYQPAESQAVYKGDCKKKVAATLVGKSSKGYRLLFEDATVRKLAPSGGALRRTLPTTTTAEDATLATLPAIEDAERAVDVEMTGMLALPPAESTTRGPVFEEAEDDRPVVRPEQLASIFDVGQSFALPPVRDMFEAVVGLYGRRPMVQAGA
ncbi:NET1-associated nuclear protein 1 [Elasticomyces elasticus]|nr:NET1-associated nuclear protein 1 [Elasticomyces elasticus]KAK4965033.1 NET1-associated nuclear protein 1 [Elasticomyces elasticus]